MCSIVMTAPVLHYYLHVLLLGEGIGGGGGGGGGSCNPCSSDVSIARYWPWGRILLVIIVLLLLCVSADVETATKALQLVNGYVMQNKPVVITYGHGSTHNR